jgi:hypothetical protein
MYNFSGTNAIIDISKGIGVKKIPSVHDGKNYHLFDTGFGK